ncbi:sensor domain-containing diguanylate cyclase [Rossellomorea aquimaris]|uniref:sensor domain-containing diguanylate cyclase n=1 Tax=Rossellomorea aquimaris TaxID=189382 RepID=UPI001CD3677A|nr:sensor domain-containing diguanylate cyclase [Rossellomorea aquimaris]MCA1055835.1 sensor domain-containing diguanylate cyclase [Rossellomorea aquimaris]
MFKRGIKLRLAIGMLIITAVISSTVVSWFAATSALRSSIEQKYLESNYNYSMKLAQSTDDLMSHMREEIVAMADIVNHHQFDQQDLDTWHSAHADQFNSTFVTDEEGYIQLLSPSIVQFKDGAKVKVGTKITSETVKKALAIKEPFISKPYQATSGQMIMLISAPIFNDEGVYRGLIGGTVYLESDNALKNILYKHELGEGSYVYVVDSDGHLIYHPDTARLDESVSRNQVVKELMEGNSGSSSVINSKGNEYYAGFTHVESTGWGIVSQTPTSVVEGPLRELFAKMAIQSVPLLIIILVIAAILASSISRPLNVLAEYSQAGSSHKKFSSSFKEVEMKSTIYEVKQLYYQINKYFTMLNKEIQIDGLTGIANRKTFDSIIKEWIDKNESFSLIMLDIDHFKQVNDTYGHLTGDEVLKFLSAILNGYAGENHLGFRYGGEEFGLLLKGVDEREAYFAAEALRKEIAATPSPAGKPITISLGVTEYLQMDDHPETIIQRADAALYQSKAAGRNQTTIFREERTSASS